MLANFALECFGVLCGGVGMFEAKIVLNSDEIKEYRSNGEIYLKKIAHDIRMYPSKYEARFIS